MSGVFKGDRFAKDAIERHGARAFFEKPFELAALLEAIDAEVRRAATAPEQATASSGHTAPGDEGGAFEVDLDFELEVDLPTAELHLDHPTTELEFHPEALLAFQEALANSAGSPIPPAAT